MQGLCMIVKSANKVSSQTVFFLQPAKVRLNVNGGYGKWPNNYQFYKLSSIKNIA